MIQNILRDQFYGGILNLEEKNMKHKGRPSLLKCKNLKTMYYDLFYCGECGCSITSKIQKSHTYYRCGRKEG